MQTGRSNATQPGGIIRGGPKPLRVPVVFITGTDTGVGKTLLTGLLLHWLRSVIGVDALALKPFISGGLGDARVLRSLQSGALGIDDLAPYRYRLPLAPAVAAEREGGKVKLATAAAHITRMRGRCGCLLVEGCGGLLSPLGMGFTSLELIRQVGAEVIVVARNQLGAINHVLLTTGALDTAGVKVLRVVLMQADRAADMAAQSNPDALSKRLKCGLSVIPYLGEKACKTGRIKAAGKFLQKTLAGLLPSDTVTALLEVAVVRAANESLKRVP